MNAHDTYLVFHPEDNGLGTICKSQQSVREEINQYGCTAGLKVWRITEGEPVRDVTADLIPEDEPERFGGDYCHADHFPALYRSVRAG